MNEAHLQRLAILGLALLLAGCAADGRKRLTPRVAKEFKEQNVIVMYGQFIHQGKFPLEQGEELTVTQAIIQKARGFACYANPSAVKLIRSTADGGFSTTIVNAGAIFRKHDGTLDPFVESGDVIFCEDKDTRWWLPKCWDGYFAHGKTGKLIRPAWLVRLREIAGTAPVPCRP